MTECVSGLVDSGKRVGEDPGGNQGAERRYPSVSELGLAAGGSHHGVGEPQELRAHPGDLHGGENDDHNAADAVRMPPRLHPQGEREHQLTSAAQLVHADCAGW